MTQDAYHELAKQMLDRWQEQLSESFKDPKLVAQNMEAMQQFYTSYFDQLKQPSGDVHAEPKPRADAASGGDELSQLQRRLEAVERRLSALEIERS